MSALTVLAPAKINLSLDVTGRREDGYHLLHTVMQSVSLADEVFVEYDRRGNGIILLCSQPGIPLDARNTCFRAAEQYLAVARLNGGVRIFLDKRIPEAAGLAGGSSDAAAVLFALSALCGKPLKPTQLQAIAARVGADVPFCLTGGTVLCTGIGEILTPLPAWPGLPLILVKPDFGLATPWVFKQLDLTGLGRRPDQTAVLRAVSGQNLDSLADATANVLESVSLPAYPELARIKSALQASGASLTLMSGSGPTLFGIYPSLGQRTAALASLPAALPAGCRIFAAETVDHGPRQTNG